MMKIIIINISMNLKPILEARSSLIDDASLKAGINAFT